MVYSFFQERLYGRANPELQERGGEDVRRM